MKIKFLPRILYILFLTTISEQVFSTPIVVSLDAPTNVVKGSLFDVDINVTGLQSNGYLLGAFSLDFHYINDDVNSFLPQPVIFGDGLGDENSFEVITDYSQTNLGPTTQIELFAVSLLFDFELASLQTDDIITLATINLFAPSFPGNFDKSSLLVADNFVLSDALGNQIDTQNSFAGETIVIPVPATLALFSLGLIVFFPFHKQYLANKASSLKNRTLTVKSAIV